MKEINKIQANSAANIKIQETKQPEVGDICYCENQCKRFRITYIPHKNAICVVYENGNVQVFNSDDSRFFTYIGKAKNPITSIFEVER